MDATHHRQFVRQLDEQLAKLDDEIRRLTGRAEWLRNVRAWHVEMSNLAPGEHQEQVAPLPLSPTTPPSTASSNGTAGRFAKSTVAEAAEVVLREAGSIQSTQAITEAIIAGGYQPRCSPHDFRTTVYSAMHRAKEVFFRARPGEWELMAWQKTSPPNPPTDLYNKALRQG